MGQQVTITALIVTYNAERFIHGCLESVKGWVDEIIVVDRFSSDKTIEIAHRYTERIIQSEEPSHELRTNIGIDAAKSEWVLKINATERITSELKEEIIKTISNNKKYAGYHIPRKNYVSCIFLEEKPGPIYLFKKGAGRFNRERAHAPIQLNGKVGYLKNFKIHWACLDVKSGIDKMNSYTSRDAKMVFVGYPDAFFWKRPVYRVNTFNLLYRTFAGFFVSYILGRYYRYGLPGLVSSMGDAFCLYTEMAKLWELQYKKEHNIKDELLPLD